MSNLFEPPPEPSIGYARVALERGIDSAQDGLTYSIPPALEYLSVGERVIVPLGKRDRSVAGVVTAIVADGQNGPRDPLLFSNFPRGSRVKPILSRDPHELSLTADLVELGRWIAQYYCCPLGMVFGTMIPAAVKRGTGTVQRTMVRLAQPRTVPSDDASEVESDDSARTSLTKLQQAVLACTQENTQEDQPWIEIRQLAQMAGARTVGPVKTLIEKGLLTTQQQQEVRSGHLQSPLDHKASTAETGTSDSTQMIAMTLLQRQAIERLITQSNKGFGVHLLHGVTGSGKTEVYIRLIEHVLAASDAQPDPLGEAPGIADDSPSRDRDSNPPGAGAIVLVPEIALTPQTVARFTARFRSVAVLHSGLTGAARHEQWRRIRRGEARVVVGARSAVFAPLPRLGVIVVDEEHDTSYKQDQLPRYHGRDVAIKRAQILGIPVVLGSGTPSLESFYNATVKKTYDLIRLPERVPGLSLPRVEVVDMVSERKTRRGLHLMSHRLEQALRQAFSENGQALLLLNRRGWAHYIACPDPGCGWLMNCQYCDAMMVYHKDRTLPTGGLLRCHHCRAEQLLPRQCPLCQKKVTIFGGGTQRLEDEMEDKFPGVRMLRMDSDSMRSGQDYEQSLSAFGNGELDLLMGTQMIAKGLDFPNVRVVGVISADSALHMPDFRASERTYQLIAQVAGRAGRGQHPGLAIVQSYQPEDPAVVRACRHDYEGFAAAEIEQRRQTGLPPCARMARIVVRDTDPAKVEEHAQRLADHFKTYSTGLDHHVAVNGPMPCSIARIAGYHRRQIELVATGQHAASDVQNLIGALRRAKLLVSDIHTAVDVDPVLLM